MNFLLSGPSIQFIHRITIPIFPAVLLETPFAKQTIKKELVLAGKLSGWIISLKTGRITARLMKIPLSITQ